MLGVMNSPKQSSMGEPKVIAGHVYFMSDFLEFKILSNTSLLESFLKTKPLVPHRMGMSFLFTLY